MENIRISGVSGNQITNKYTYLGNSPEFRVVLEPCERILTIFHYFPMFPLHALCLLFHFLGLRSFPSTLPYCTSLTILRARTRLPLRCIRSLVYILRVLVIVDLRTNITYSPLVSV